MRARLASTGSGRRHGDQPACIEERPESSPTRAWREVRGGRAPALWSSSAGSGGRGRRASGSGSSAANHRKPRRAQLVGHRVRPDRDRPAVDGRLDRGVAEALPRRRERDGVGGGVGVGHRAGRRPVEHRRRRAGEQRVAARRRSRPRPGRAASRWRRAPRPARARPGRPCARWPAPGGRTSRSSSATPSAARVAGAVARRARRRRSRCRSSSPRCPRSAISRSGQAG